MEQVRTMQQVRTRDRSGCDGSGPGQGTPREDGTGRGKVENQRGNPEGNGSGLKDGSGRSGGKGKGQGGKR